MEGCESDLHGARGLHEAVRNESPQAPSESALPFADADRALATAASVQRWAVAVRRIVVRARTVWCKAGARQSHGREAFPRNDFEQIRPRRARVLSRLSPERDLAPATPPRGTSRAITIRIGKSVSLVAFLHRRWQFVSCPAGDDVSTRGVERRMNDAKFRRTAAWYSSCQRRARFVSSPPSAARERGLRGPDEGSDPDRRRRAGDV